ncbi:MAG: MerR family transcriptional regulator [Rhodococcus sp. (in: high G+C Gram-positive bacteria)]|uniref:MerR family transcriptional regulator n=1 Tax=Rhodococcus sp. TaxID=1831 RepID=UPI003BB58067
MRISELARAAETTVRTVRHYHRLGLLPEPPRSSNGYRVYALEDLVRLMRIRWLARSGVPLGSVAAVLGAADDTDDLGADLEALLGAVEEQQRILQVKRDSLAEMLDLHRRGEPLSPLAAPLAQAFTELVDGEDDPRVRELFVRERDAWEILALSGQTPKFVGAAAAGLVDPVRRREIVELYRRFGALAGYDPSTASAEIEAVADALAGFFDDLGDPDGLFTQWSTTAADVTDSPHLAEFLPDPAQRAVAVRVIDAIAARVENP